MLGPTARDISDEQLEIDLKAAEFFKNIFFSLRLTGTLDRASKPKS